MSHTQIYLRIKSGTEKMIPTRWCVCLSDVKTLGSKDDVLLIGLMDVKNAENSLKHDVLCTRQNQKDTKTIRGKMSQCRK